jgi:hypothetical protein
VLVEVYERLQAAVPTATLARLDADQLAAELSQLAAELHHNRLITGMSGTGRTGVIARYLASYLARAVTPGCLLAVTDGNQPIPSFTREIR